MGTLGLKTTRLLVTKGSRHFISLFVIIWGRADVAMLMLNYAKWIYPPLRGWDTEFGLLLIFSKSKLTFAFAFLYWWWRIKEGDTMMPVAHFYKEVFTTFGSPFLIKVKKVSMHFSAYIINLLIFCYFTLWTLKHF